MSARPVLIDTDPGVDDAMALFTALASPELEVLGLTTVFGNAHTDTTTRNALILLEVAGRDDLPVAVGAAVPVARDYIGPVPHVHGSNGLGDAALPVPRGEPADEAAVDLIWETVSTRPGEVTLLALGPLTNLAQAVERHPEVVDLVADVVVMGGNALGPGNATPAAEANIHNDPEAADVVFGAGWDITMVGLDVTHQVIMGDRDIDALGRVDTPTAQLLTDAIPCYRRFFHEATGIDGIFLHDPAAVARLVEPDLFGVERWPLRVETESFSRGKTWPWLGGNDDLAPAAWQGRPPVTVCTAVDSEKVVELVLGRLGDR